MAVQLLNFVTGTAGQLTTANVTYYTSTNVKSKILSATLANTSVSTVTVDVWIIPFASSNSDPFRVIVSQPILPGQSYNCPELVNKNIMQNGVIQAQASANTAITFIVSGAIVS